MSAVFAFLSGAALLLVSFFFAITFALKESRALGTHALRGSRC